MSVMVSHMLVMLKTLSIVTERADLREPLDLARAAGVIRHGRR